MHARQIAEAFGLAFLGPERLDVAGPDPFDRAGPGSFTWVKTFSKEALIRLQALHGATIVVPEPHTDVEIAAVESASASNALLPVPNPRLAFARMLSRFFSHLELKTPHGIDLTARIEPTARIGQGVTIGPFCYVGAGASIGDRTVLQPGAIVHSDTIVGADCVLGSYSVVGQRGFGFVRDDDGRLVPFPQVGRVVLEDGVEIKTFTVVDRPGLGETRLLRGSKFDNHCHVSHGARVGPNAVVTACAEIGAGVIVGEDVWLGPQSCSIEGVTIGREAFVGIGAVVLRDVPAGAVVAGNPAEPIEQVKRVRKALKKLVESGES